MIMYTLACAGCTLSTVLIGAISSFLITVYLFIRRFKRK